jgi:hypothetical protein
MRSRRWAALAVIALLPSVGGAGEAPPESPAYKALGEDYEPRRMSLALTTVRLGGAYEVVFGTTPLDGVRQRVGAGTVATYGVGEDAYHWLCYTAKLFIGSARVWFVSHDKFGGPTHVLSAVVATKLSMTQGATTDCPQLPPAMQSVQLAGGFWLDALRADVPRHLRARDAPLLDVAAYGNETVPPGTRVGFADRIELSLDRDLVTGIWASHVPDIVFPER